MSPLTLQIHYSSTHKRFKMFKKSFDNFLNNGHTSHSSSSYEKRMQRADVMDTLHGASAYHHIPIAATTLIPAIPRVSSRTYLDISEPAVIVTPTNCFASNSLASNNNSSSYYSYKYNNDYYRETRYF
jgi:hypothetical protein